MPTPADPNNRTKSGHFDHLSDNLVATPLGLPKSRKLRVRQGTIVLGRFLVSHRLYRNQHGYWSARVRDLVSGKAFRLSTGVNGSEGPSPLDLVHLMVTRQLEQIERSQRELDETLSQSSSPSWLGAYREHMQDRAAVASRRQVEDACKLYVPVLAEKKVDEIVEDDVLAILRSFKAKGLKARTLNWHRGNLRTFFKWCLKRGYARFDPTGDVKKAKGAEREGQPLSVEEAKRLLDACRSTTTKTVAYTDRQPGKQSWNPPGYLYLVVFLGLKLGLRKSNILKLQWSQIDLGSGVLKISGEEMKSTRGLTVPIESELLGVLRARQAELNPAPSGRVVGKQILDFKRSWRTALRKAGLQDRRFHDTRTTFSTWLAEAGVPLQVCICLTGHSSRSIGVHGRYVKPQMPALREAVEKLPRLLD